MMGHSTENIALKRKGAVPAASNGVEDLLDRAACLAAGALIFLFERIPLALGLRIGDLAGRAVFYVSGKRRVAYVNLKAALGDRLTSSERWKIVRDHYGNMGKMIVEVLALRKMTLAHIEKNIQIPHLEHFRELRKDGRGAVLLTAHFGNWELLQVVGGLRVAPIHVLARDQKFPRLNSLLNRLRESHGSVAISRGAGLRSLVRALRDKQMIGVLGDQSAGKEGGILLSFFGRRTTVPTGAFELAQRTQAKVLPFFMVRTGGVKHKIYGEEPLNDDASLDPKARVETQARQYLALLEDYIRRFPDQWLWENKRWKYSWDRKVVILSDGKAGHVKQSEAVAEMLSEFKEFHGRSGLMFETRTILVEYRSAFHRAALFLLAFLMRPWIQGQLRWLAPFLAPNTQKAIEEATADHVIAAGSGLAPAQMLLARETGAKSVVIMNPPFPYSLTHYDLAIVPAHDGRRVPGRAFRCVVMPSGLKSLDRGADVEALRTKLGKEDPPRTAVFIGGATRGYDLTVSGAEKLCTALKRSASRAGDYMITTSRRTPPAVDRFLKSVLAQHSRCRLLVVANEENPSYAAGGMMGLAELLIVTEDSLAMISEAVGAGKRVIVLSLGEGELPAKHYRFHQILATRGLVTLSGLADLEANIVGLLKKPATPVLQREKDALMERLKELI